MGVLDRLEDEFVDVSTGRATVRELFELAFGSALFALIAGGLAYYLLGRTVALAVVAVLVVVFAITVASQAYWALTGRADYEE